MKPLLPIVAALLTSISLSTLADDASRTLPFQARLTDAAGQPLPNGVALVQFQLFDGAQGRDPVWTGELHRLSVNQGLVNVVLGTRNPFPRDRRNAAGAVLAFFETPLYLEITVDTTDAKGGKPDGNITPDDLPLRPRQTVLPVPFATEAGDSRKLAGHDWSVLLEGQANDPTSARLAEAKLPAGVSVPVGTVISWWGKLSQLPPNFELCDGNAPTTPGATLTGAKPDLRDRFLKGANPAAQDVRAENESGGRHFDPEQRTGGTALSIDQMPSHSHPWDFVDGTPIYRSTPPQTTEAGGFEPGGWYAPTTGHGSLFIYPVGGNQPHDHSLPAHDNRPAFVSLFFLIRVK